MEHVTWAGIAAAAVAALQDAARAACSHCRRGHARIDAARCTFCYSTSSCALPLTQFACLTLSASGIEVVTEANQVVQGACLSITSPHTAHAYLYASIFDKYEFEAPANWLALERERHDAALDQEQPPCIAFEINLATLISCLGLFETRLARRTVPSRAPGAQDTVDLVYGGVGEPLCLRMGDERLETSFRLRTLDSPLLAEMAFDPEDTTAQVIMKSMWLAPAFQELTAGGEAALTLVFEPAGAQSKGRLELRTRGTYGTSEIDFPHDNVLTEKFACPAPVTHSYPLDSVHFMLPALRHSLKTSLRTDSRGMLSVQFMIASARAKMRSTSVHDSGHAFVEFLCCPLTEAY